MISKGNESIIVTVDDSGAYIIKDSAGRKVFFSKRQAELMKLSIKTLIKDAFANIDEKDIKIEEIKE
jgi:ribosomal protein S11